MSQGQPHAWVLPNDPFTVYGCYLPFMLIRDRFTTTIMHVCKMPRRQPHLLPGAQSQSKPGAVVEAHCCSSPVAQEQLPEDETPGWQHLKFLGTLHGGRGWLLALCMLCLGVTLSVTCLVTT